MIRPPRPKVVFFGWPSEIGGATTKLAHLLDLLCDHCELTVVPNTVAELAEKRWTGYMEARGIRYCLIDDLPEVSGGWAVSLCNGAFIAEGIAIRAKEKGLKVVWSGEMMWAHPGEEEAVEEGLIDVMLYASTFQMNHLEGCHQGVKSKFVTGNYIDPQAFPWKERSSKDLTLGRLSRPDPDKFPADFPVFYECLNVPNAKYRVMAWDRHMAEEYSWFDFSDRWDLLDVGAECAVDFLHSLDLFVYPLGHTFLESWGRSTVEAMLCGCIPLVPDGHQFEALIKHGHSGFICANFEDYYEIIQTLIGDPSLRKEIARSAGWHARKELCNREVHLQHWMAIFNESN